VYGPQSTDAVCFRCTAAGSVTVWAAGW